MRRLLTILFLLVACVAIHGCGYGERIKQAEHAAEKAQQTADGAKRTATDAAEQIKRLTNERDRAWFYVKCLLWAISLVTILRLFGKPIVRVLSAYLLRSVSLTPRQIVNTKGRSETGLEQT